MSTEKLERLSTTSNFNEIEGQLHSSLESSRVFKCCFGKVHVRRATFLIGCFHSAALIVLNLYCLGTWLLKGDHWAAGYVLLTVAVLGLVALIALFMAVQREQQMLLIPHFLMQLLSVLALTVLGCIYLYLLTEELRERSSKEDSRNSSDDSEQLSLDRLTHITSEANRDARVFVASIYLIGCFSAAVVEFWWLSIIWRCQRYMRLKKVRGSDSSLIYCNSDCQVTQRLLSTSSI